MFLATEAGEVSKPVLVDLYGDADATIFAKQEFANEGLKPTKKNYLQASIRVKLFFKSTRTNRLSAQFDCFEFAF